MEDKIFFSHTISDKVLKKNKNDNTHENET